MAIRLSGLSSGLDTEGIIKELMSAQSMKKTKVQNKLTKLEWKEEKWKELNKKIYSLYTDELSKLKSQSSYITKSVTSSDSSKATFKANSSVPVGTHTLDIKSVASSQFVTGNKVTANDDSGNKVNISSSTGLTSIKFGNESIQSGTKLKLTVGSKTVEKEIKDDTTIKDLTDWFKESDISFTYDAANERFFLSSTQSGTENAFSLESTDGNKALKLLGLGSIDHNGSDLDGVKVVPAQDMTCIFNGQSYTSSSNTLTINGLTINAIDKTDGEMKINVSNDTSAVYDTIKNFVTKYNEILGEINDLYYAGSAKGYDVLTDEEREAMTEEQIEKWENKIKDSLLRRDNTLGSVRSSLISITSKTVEVDGKAYSLSSFGITTTDYTEKGLLHIYGNPDDSSVSDKTDLLSAALEQDPDTVMQVFTGIASELYSDLSSKMSSTSLSSALTFYNDKEITSLKKQYQDEIDKWEDRLKEMEDRYYAKFSAMETALSKLNSQTSSLTSLFSSGS